MVICRCDKCGKRMTRWFGVRLDICYTDPNLNAADMIPYKGEYQICFDCWSSFIKENDESV